MFNMSYYIFGWGFFHLLKSFFLLQEGGLSTRRPCWIMMFLHRLAVGKQYYFVLIKKFMSLKCFNSDSSAVILS